MNMQEAIAYLDNVPRFIPGTGPDHARYCLERLGNPQDSFSVIHVAGTNGKGSVCAFLSSILREAGQEVGLFTSPHLLSYNERFKINGKDTDDDAFLSAFCEVKDLAEELIKEGKNPPHHLSMIFLMGMVLFARKGLKWVVIETGLGGRMDATNALPHPAASVITSISLDHTKYLGDTVEAIAGEKAGIIKAGAPVIFDGSDPRSANVIRAAAETAGNKYSEVLPADIKLLSQSGEGIDFIYKSTSFHIPFVAQYQMMNASLALNTMDMLSDKLAISPKDMEADKKAGLSSCIWRGRMDRVLPGVIIDGAHNEDGIAAFVQTACQFQKDYDIYLLFAAVSDKNYPEMIRRILDKLSLRQVITTRVGGDREVPSERLAEIFREYGCGHVTACDDPARAFRDAVSLRDKRDAELKAQAAPGEPGCKKGAMLFCVGSLYLAATAMSTLKSER